MQHTLFSIKEHHQKKEKPDELKTQAEPLPVTQLQPKLPRKKAAALWADKHKPKTVEEIAGQNKSVEEVLGLLAAWKPGKAIMITGPPGCGKTLLAETIAAERGWALAALNASDDRGAKDVEAFCNQEAENRPMFNKNKLILIDEADGLSGHSDRGAVGAIADMVKRSKFPVIIIAADPYSQKLKPLRVVSAVVKFSRLHPSSIAKRLKEICEKEGVEASESVLKALSGWSQGDLRSAIGDLQMVCAGRKKIDAEALESLGNRERPGTIFEALPAIFHSGSMKAGRKVMFEADADADEILWWVESNAQAEFDDPQELAAVFDALSVADIFRHRVMVQQNWRFKAYMSDIIAGVSALKKVKSHGWIKYEQPLRIMMMGRTKFTRGVKDSAYTKIGQQLHVSTKVVASEYVYLLKILLAKNPGLAEQFKLTSDEAELLTNRL